MATKRLLLTVTTVLVLLALPASASAKDKVLYEQAPGHFGGFLSDGLGITVADEFQLRKRASINQVVWWGGYGATGNQPVPTTDDFTIRIFGDNNGMPGSVLTTLHPGNDVHRTATSDWVNPPDYPVFEGRGEFKYAIGITSNVLAGRYWLSIVNVPSSDIWLWEVSGSSSNLGVQRSFADPVFGPWEPSSYNTAFQLTGK